MVTRVSIHGFSGKILKFSIVLSLKNGYKTREFPSGLRGAWSRGRPKALETNRIGLVPALGAWQGKHRQKQASVGAALAPFNVQLDASKRSLYYKYIPTISTLTYYNDDDYIWVMKLDLINDLTM